MKTIGIFTEGGTGIGLGHLTRCSALAYALKMRGYSPAFFIFSYDDVGRVVQPFRAQHIDWRVDIAGIIRQEHLSFTIIDSYLASQEVYEVTSRLLDGQMLIIDDYMRLIYPRSLVVNFSIYGKTFKYPTDRGQEYLLGEDYVILRPDFWEAGPKSIKDKIENIFLTLGGWADRETLEQIAAFIKNRIDANICILDSYQKKYSAQEMREMMAAADLCVSAGGQTMYELARMGVPTISVTLADNQSFNMKGFEKIGFSYSAGRIDDDLFLDKLKEGIEYMNDPIVRKRCSLTGQRFVDGKGTHRLADIIAETFRTVS